MAKVTESTLFLCLCFSLSYSQESVGPHEPIDYWRRNSVLKVNFEPLLFQYLNVSLLGTVSVDERMDCGMACVYAPLCLSFNVAVSRDANMKLWCELLSSIKHENADKLGANLEAHHYSIQNPCASGPCLNGGTCAPLLYRQGTFQCVCRPGYLGSECRIAPLECHQYSVLSEPDRRSSYGRGSISDSTISPGWYRFQHSTYSKMLDTCISHHRCSADITGWLRGGHPLVTDRVVTRDACFHGFYQCCWKKVQIRVRECNGFYVYELKPSPAGAFRFCTTS